MKKSVLLMAGVCLLSSMTAFADPVTSVNAVGVVKVVVPEGFSLLACPLSQIGGLSLTVDQVLGGDVLDGTTLWFYMPQSSSYFPYTYSALDGGWIDDGGKVVGTNKILRGEGFWIQSLTNMTISISGEVPSSNTAPTTAVTLVPGFTLFGFAYPSLTSITNSIDAAEGDTIWRYSPDTGYAPLTYSPLDGGWVDDGGIARDVILKVGEGAWYQSVSGSDRIWVQDRPYTWP